ESQNASSGNVGIWDWDIAGGRTYWSEIMWLIYGVEPENTNPDEAFWLSRVHESYRERAKKSTYDVLGSKKNRHRDTSRVITKDGGVKWIESSATVLRDREGKPIRMYGVDLDITDLKNAEERIRRSENELRLITNSVPALIAYADRDKR